MLRRVGAGSNPDLALSNLVKVVAAGVGRSGRLLRQRAAWLLAGRLEYVSSDNDTGAGRGEGKS